MQEKLMSLLILVILAFSFIPSAHAIAIGVNRADISFEDVLRGGYAEESIVISTDSAQTITGALEVEGNIADWIRFEPADVEDGFDFSARQPRQVTIIIEPPNDAANGDYEGIVRVITGEILRDGDGQFGTSTRAAFKIDALVGVTDVEIQRCVIAGINLRSTEINQPIDVTYSVENNGNVRIAPELDVTIFDQEQETIIATQSVETAQEVLPTRTEQFVAQLTNELEPGQYWATVKSEECSGSSLVTFDVLERGGIADSGEFVRIDMESFVEAGEIVPIYAVFKNTGTRTVSAKFKGTVMQGSRLVKVIDTDFYDTPPNQLARIETFFNPDVPGQYEVKGRVLYNNKLTFERIGILNVSGKSLNSGFNIFPIVLIVVIILLLLLIIKKKKRKRRF